MKGIVLFIFCICLSFHATAQIKRSQTLNEKVKGKTNYDDIINEAKKHFDEKKRLGQPNFESKELKWARWAYLNSSRLDENGNIVNIGEKNYAAWQELREMKPRENDTGDRSTDASWTFTGPWNNNYYAGLYRGLARIDEIGFHPNDPNILFACAPNGGLWKSTNNGMTWDIISFYFPINSVGSMAISPSNPNVMYAITGDADGGGNANGVPTNNSSGLWVTFDGGYNWLRTNFNRNRQLSNDNGYKVMVHPNDQNTVFVCTNSGFYRSTDGGNTWDQRLFFTIFDMEFDPSDPDRIYLSGLGIFLYSTNNGIDFPNSQRTLLPGTTRIELGVSPANSNYVYAVAGPFVGGPGSNTYGGFYRSVLKGQGMSLVSNTPNILCWATDGILQAADNDQSSYDLALAVSPTNINDVYVGGKIIWRTTDGGANFTNITPFSEGNQNAVPPNNYVHPDIHDLAFHPLVAGRLFTGTDGGVYFTDNNGANWTTIANIHATTFNHMDVAAYDSNKILAGCQDNGVKYKKDAGDFTHISGADGFACSFGNAAAVGMYASINNSIVRYNINGDEIAITNPANLGFYPIILADPVNANTVYLADNNNGILKSTNNGSSWTTINALATNVSMAISPANGNRLYVASGSTLLRTDNGGSTWSSDLTSNPGFNQLAQIVDIGVCPTNSDLVYIAVGNYTAGVKVFYSGDAGQNWTNISGSLPANIKVNCVTVDDFNNAYLGTDLGVFFQASTATDWTPFFNELPRIPVYDLVISAAAGKIRACTFGHGIWETNIYSPCDQVATYNNITIAGEKYFQTSIFIGSNATIGGGDVTKVTMRAGEEIALTDGFTVTERNEFWGQIFPCDGGPVPTDPNGLTPGGKTSQKTIPPVYTHMVHRGDEHGVFSLGQLDLEKLEVKNPKHSLDEYTIIIKNLENGFEERVFENGRKSNKVSNTNWDRSSVNDKKHVLLFHKDKLIQVHEI